MKDKYRNPSSKFTKIEKGDNETIVAPRCKENLLLDSSCIA